MVTDKHFRPSETWTTTQGLIDKKEPKMLIADDTILAKRHSKKNDLVNYQYSGDTHDVIAGIRLLNLLMYGLESGQAIPVDYYTYDKDTDAM